MVYYNYIQAPFAAELLEAAEIMGITMRIGIEYAACFRGRYVQLIWVPRGFIDTQAFLCFLTEPPVRALMEEGRQISEYRQQQVLQVLDAFNRCHLSVINETYGISLKPIDPSAFLTFVKPGQTSLLHLAKFIHIQLLPELDKKVVELRLQCDTASPQEQCLNDTRVAEMNRLDFETILERFLSPAQNPDLVDPQVVQDEPDVPPLLRLSPSELLCRLVQLRTAYRITLNLTDLRPEDVLELIYDCDGLITRLETFNLKDYTGGKTTLVPEISRLQVAINEGNVITLKRIILNIMDQAAVSARPDKADRLEKLAAILHDINALRLYVQRHAIEIPYRQRFNGNVAAHARYGAGGHGNPARKSGQGNFSGGFGTHDHSFPDDCLSPGNLCSAKRTHPAAQSFLHLGSLSGRQLADPRTTVRTGYLWSIAPVWSLRAISLHWAEFMRMPETSFIFVRRR